MAWLESHQELARHPKTKRLARLASISLPQALGHLHLLWWWALDYAEDGDLTKWEAPDIADAMQWEGDPEQLISALISAGFLDADPLRVHDWTDYAGKLLEQRAHHSKRALRNRTLYADMEIVHAVRDRDGDFCRYCGGVVDWKDKKSGKGGTYDHVDPEAGNSEANVVVSCRSCNAKKGRRTPDAAGMPLLPPEHWRIDGKTSADNLPTLTGPNRTKPNQATPPPTPPRGADSTPIPIRSADALPPATAVPKPNRSSEVIDLLRAQGLPDTLGPRDHAAIKRTSAAPALIVEAFAAAFNGEWDPGGDGWLRESLSLHSVIDRLAGYLASKNDRANGRRRDNGKPTIYSQRRHV